MGCCAMEKKNSVTMGQQVNSNVSSSPLTTRCHTVEGSYYIASMFVSAKNTNKEALRRVDLHYKDRPTKCLQTRFRTTEKGKFRPALTCKPSRDK